MHFKYAIIHVSMLNQIPYILYMLLCTHLFPCIKAIQQNHPKYMQLYYTCYHCLLATAFMEYIYTLYSFHSFLSIFTNTCDSQENIHVCIYALHELPDKCIHSCDGSISLMQRHYHIHEQRAEVQHTDKLIN